MSWGFTLQSLHVWPLHSNLSIQRYYVLWSAKGSYLFQSVQMCRTTKFCEKTYYKSVVSLILYLRHTTPSNLDVCHFLWYYESSTGVPQSSPISFSRSCTRFAPVRLYTQPSVDASQSNLEGPLHWYTDNIFTKNKHYIYTCNTISTSSLKKEDIHCLRQTRTI